MALDPRHIESPIANLLSALAHLANAGTPQGTTPRGTVRDWATRLECAAQAALVRLDGQPVEPGPPPNPAHLIDVLHVQNRFACCYSTRQQNGLFKPHLALSTRGFGVTTHHVGTRRDDGHHAPSIGDELNLIMARRPTREERITFARLTREARVCIHLIDLPTDLQDVGTHAGVGVVGVMHWNSIEVSLARYLGAVTEVLDLTGTETDRDRRLILVALQSNADPKAKERFSVMLLELIKRNLNRGVQ